MVDLGRHCAGAHLRGEEEAGCSKDGAADCKPRPEALIAPVLGSAAQQWGSPGLMLEAAGEHRCPLLDALSGIGQRLKRHWGRHGGAMTGGLGIHRHPALSRWMSPGFGCATKWQGALHTIAHTARRCGRACFGLSRMDTAPH